LLYNMPPQSIWIDQARCKLLKTDGCFNPWLLATPSQLVEIQISNSLDQLVNLGTKNPAWFLQCFPNSLVNILGLPIPDAYTRCLCEDICDIVLLMFFSTPLHGGYIHQYLQLCAKVNFGSVFLGPSHHPLANNLICKFFQRPWT
jgi:hypothetical protein